MPEQTSILLVEDDLDLADALKIALGGAGFRVLHTTSGIDAIELATREEVALVIMDLQIHELSGEGVMRVLSDLALAKPLIVMSGQPNGWQADAFRHGATACLRKPFSISQLRSLVGSSRFSGESNGWPEDVRQLEPADLDAISQLSPEQLDALPFGAMLLDADRRIVRYNRFESDAVGYYVPSVIGTRFEDLAPCTTVKEFTQALDEAFETGTLDRVLRFVFPRHGALALVSVRLFFDPHFQRVWVFVSQRRGELAGELLGLQPGGLATFGLVR